MLVIFARAGCRYCDDAKALAESRGVDYVVEWCDDLDDARAKLGFLAPPSLRSFPIVVDRDTKRVIGGYQQLRDELSEPILQDSLSRFSAFPIEYPDIYEIYKKAVASFWTADEISLTQDVHDFQTLTSDERHFVKHILAFFASSDGIVNENLLKNFSNEVQIAEARQFYAYQAFNEAEHNRTYGMLIDALIRDIDERDRLFDAIVHVPVVQRKAQWALKWLDPSTRSFAERLVAFMCVEGILFSGSFCAIFWMKKYRPGLMPGLSLSNQFIARDEALHCEHAAALYAKLQHPLSREVLEDIVGEAVRNEQAFIADAVPCSLVGMNPVLMSQYIEFVADALLADIGQPPMFNAKNPFPWMETIGLEGKTNFFENRVSEYSRAGIMSGGDGAEFSLHADF